MANTLTVSAKRTYVRLRQRLKGYQQAQENRQVVEQHTRLPHIFLYQELKQLLDCDDAWLQETAGEYYRCTDAWKLLSGLRSSSPKTDGYAKSLDVAEGFALWALVKQQQPKVVVELGSQYGISARLWKEALKQYVPQHELILCDLADNRRFIDDRECTFLKGDARKTLKQVFASRQVHLLHNDAHPYDLIHWSVEAALQQRIPILTFHDVGGYQLRGGPFKPEASALSKAEKAKYGEDYGPYGAWERHVMAEILDQRLVQQDFVVTPEWRIQIFDSFLGFGVAVRTDRIGVPA